MNRLKPTIASIAALLLSTASVAGVNDPQKANTSVTVQSVGVSHTPDGIQIEITGNGALQQKSMHLSGPERLVVDLPNSVPSTQRTIAVNAPEARDVRVAQFQAAPPITRVVVDLGPNVKYEISAQSNRVLVNLHGGTASAAAATQSAPSTKPSPMQAKSAIAPHAAAPKLIASNQKSSSAPSLTSAAYNATPHATAQPTEKASTGKQSAESKQQSTPPQAASNPGEKSSEQTSVDADSEETATSAPAANSSADASKDASAKDFVVADAKPAAPTSDTDAAPNANALFPSANASAPGGTAPAPKPAAPETKPAAPVTKPADPAPSSASAATAAMTAANLAREQQQENARVQSASLRAKYTGAPYSFNLKDADLKDFFRAIAEITGLNIVLDPNVKGTLTLDLHDVPWDQALDLVLENNNLDKQLEGNVLRIATVDTLRQEAEAQLAKEKAQALAVNITTYTHYLSYAHAKDVKETVKKFLSSRGDISSDERTNAVIVRDIPSTIPEIQRLLIQLDRKTQQVEIEARVVAATRNFAREIGTQLAVAFGGSIGNAGITGNGAPAAGQSPIAVGYPAPPPYATNPGIPAPPPIPVPPAQPTTTLTYATVPLFSNLGLAAPSAGYGIGLTTANFRLDTMLTLAESRGLLKVLSRPHVVTQNNVKAIVRQGLRVPVVTQAQLGGPPTVSYVDAFLKLTVTPQITAEGTVFLDLEVENTTADFSREVQGNPTLVTQGEQTQVLVTNGGTVQIGGVMLTNNTVNIFQVPLLGDIPILGNAFKHRQVSTSTQELIFFITPKIIES